MQVVSFWNDAYSCDTGALIGSHQNGYGCPCTAPADIAAFADGAIIPGFFGCETSGCQASSPDSNTCDGVENNPSGPTDEGCGDDEYKCDVDNDRDPFPVRYSSGRVEVTPVTVFQEPTPGNLFFGVRLYYNSFTSRVPARKVIVTGQSPDTVPTIHSIEEDTHFYGQGWLDNISDRLNIDVVNQVPSKITWVRPEGVVTSRTPLAAHTRALARSISSSIEAAAHPRDGSSRRGTRRHRRGCGGSKRCRT